MKAVIYARVSTEQQDSNFSIPSQIERALLYAQQHGMEVFKVYSEKMSGTVYPRPELEKALADIEQGRAQALIVHAEDRLNRDYVNGHLIRARLVRAGAELHLSLGGLCNLDEQLVRIIEDAIGADELKRIRERVNRGMKQKVKGGAYPGKGVPPFGYKVVGDGREMRLEINEETAKWAKLIFAWYLGGVGVTEIINRLEANEVDRPGWGVHKSKLPRYRWQPVAIYGMLRSEVYIGSYWYGQTTYSNGVRTANPREDWIEVKVPPLVDAVSFAKAQAMLNQGREKSRRNRKRPCLLSGMIRCQFCGSSITSASGNSKRKMGPPLMYYRCTSYRFAKKARRCNLPHFRMDAVDEIVWNCVQDLFSNPELLRLSVIEARDKARRDNQHLYEARQDIEAGIGRARGRLERAMRQFVDSDDPDSRQIAKRQQDEVKSALAHLYNERERYNQEILAIQISDETLEAVEDISRQLGAEMAEFTTEEKRRVLRDLGASAQATVENGERVVYLRVLLITHRLVVEETSSGEIRNKSLLSNVVDYRGNTVTTAIPLTFRLVLAA